MPAPRDLQRAFGAAIVDAGHAGAVAPLFRGRVDVTPARLAVYRGNVYGNRINALAAAYPIVRKIVGAEFFEATAREFARTQPSTSGDLNEYGATFPGFLAGFPHTQDLPYLPDVARMEWLAHRAYYAADAEPLDLARLANVAPERWVDLRPVLAPACAILVSDWPLARFWDVHQDGYPGSVEVDPAAGPDRVLVHRPRWRAAVCSLGTGDYRFLTAAREGATLGDALEAAAADADAAFDPARALARWVEAGVVVELGESWGEA